MKRISNKFHQGALTTNYYSLVIFAVSNSLNPLLPSVAKNDRKWFQCLRLCKITNLDIQLMCRKKDSKR